VNCTWSTRSILVRSFCLELFLFEKIIYRNALDILQELYCLYVIFHCFAILSITVRYISIFRYPIYSDNVCFCPIYYDIVRYCTVYSDIVRYRPIYFDIVRYFSVYSIFFVLVGHCFLLTVCNRKCNLWLHLSKTRALSIQKITATSQACFWE
jgi:hypothetical protein